MFNYLYTHSPCLTFNAARIVSYMLYVLHIVTNSGPPGVRTAAPSNGDRLAHRHGQFCRSPSGRCRNQTANRDFSLFLSVRGALVRGRVNRPDVGIPNYPYGYSAEGKYTHLWLATDTSRLNGSLRDRNNRAEVIANQGGPINLYRNFRENHEIGYR